MTKNQTLMWEVRCEPGKAAAVEEWVRAVIVPPLWEDEEVASYNAYTSVGQEDGDRVVVVIDYLGAAPTTLAADPPDRLIARPPHAWIFQRLDA